MESSSSTQSVTALAMFIGTLVAVVTLAMASIRKTNESRLPKTTTGSSGNNNHRTNAPVMSKGTILKLRDKQTGPNIQVFYRREGGLVVTEGRGVFMIDDEGNEYLDCCNNVACVGHSHPAVVEAGRAELGRIQTNSRFLHPVQQRYLAKLLATFPPELNTVYLVNSGSEANDLALRIAQQHNTAKKRNDVICIDHAYHGHTHLLIGVSPYKWHQAVDFVNRQPETTHVVSCPDRYRGKHRLTALLQNGGNVHGEDVKGKAEETIGCLYATEVEAVVEETGGVGAFIAESVVGCGGQIIPPRGYFQRCYAAVRAGGGVCIADEVQTGFGRAGTHFWAFQAHGVVPDIVTLGKPMGNGYPIGAVVCQRALAESFASTGIEYFNTFAGNSVACTMAEAVLDTIHNEKLQENSLVVGRELLDRLQRLAERYPVVGDVRGMGLFVGVEFVRVRGLHNGAMNSASEAAPASDRAAAHHVAGASAAVETAGDNFLEAHPDLTAFLVGELMRDRVVVSRDGPDENVIKIKPPLVFSQADVDTLVWSLERALLAAQKTGMFF